MHGDAVGSPVMRRPFRTRDNCYGLPGTLCRAVMNRPVGTPVWTVFRNACMIVFRDGRLGDDAGWVAENVAFGEFFVGGDLGGDP